MQQDRIIITHLQDELADRFQKRQPLDIAGRSADLGDKDIGVADLLEATNTTLDLVGDVRDNLYRLSEIVSPALV